MYALFFYTPILVPVGMYSKEGFGPRIYTVDAPQGCSSLHSNLIDVERSSDEAMSGRGCMSNAHATTVLHLLELDLLSTSC